MMKISPHKFEEIKFLNVYHSLNCQQNFTPWWYEGWLMQVCGLFVLKVFQMQVTYCVLMHKFIVCSH